MMKQIKQYHKVLILFSLFLCSGIKGYGATTRQDSSVYRISSINDTLQVRLAFYKDSLLTVSDPAHTLADFIRAMQELKAGKDTVVSIVHLGDSHIQAGFLTGQTMRLLHSEYGNAGRGWIAPFKLSKTNEPLDYFFNSSVKEWKAGRITQGTKKTAIGPGGIGIESEATDISLQIGRTPKNGVGYSFDEMIFYRDARSMPMLVTGKFKNSTETKHVRHPVVSGILTDTFRLSYSVDTIQLKSTRTDPWSGLRMPAGDFTNIYYGALLKNGKTGVLYHSVGINGAMFVNYTNPQFIERLSLLTPSLLIVSLGTNETFGRRFTESEFAGQVEAFLTLVKEYMPQVPVILTTPPECYRSVTVNKKKSYVRNEKTVLAAQAIVQIAQEKGIACWDLFSATGGKNSSEMWYKGKWMGSDRIHFNQEGYKEQGTLLFKTLYNLITKENSENQKETNDSTDY